MTHQYEDCGSSSWEWFVVSFQCFLVLSDNFSWLFHWHTDFKDISCNFLRVVLRILGRPCYAYVLIKLFEKLCFIGLHQDSKKTVRIYNDITRVQYVNNNESIVQHNELFVAFKVPHKIVTGKTKWDFWQKPETISWNTFYLVGVLIAFIILFWSVSNISFFNKIILNLTRR